MPRVYNKGLYLINHNSYLIILTLGYYPTKHYLMEVSWVSEHRVGKALGPRKFKPSLFYHTAIPGCIATGAYGCWSFFICILCGMRARVDFSNFLELIRYSRIMLADSCVGLGVGGVMYSYTLHKCVCRYGTQVALNNRA